MNNNTIIIDQYLQQELSVSEKMAFENRLANEPMLAEELAWQQKIVDASVFSAIKNNFSGAIKKKVMLKNMLRWAIVLGAATICTLLYFKRHEIFPAEYKTAMSRVAKPLEKYEIDPARDTIIESRDGVVFAIPAGSFNSPAEKIQIEIQAAIHPCDIMRLGLSTTSNDSLLQTAGMFSIQGYADGKTLPLVKKIQVSVPAYEINPAMKLFDGIQDSAGIINWVNPQPIEHKLRTVDITTLDFYPPNYIPALKALKKNYKNKKYTDSLYYSFSGYPGHERGMPAPLADSSKKAMEETLQQASINKGNMDRIGGPFLQDTLPPEQLVYNDLTKDTLDDHNLPYAINPAKIKAIWNKKYDHTILATKEFEERLKYMHGLCSDEAFMLYLQNLSRPLYYTDEILASKAADGASRNKFREFALRKNGGVFVTDGMQQKLNDYFQKKYKAYEDAVAKTREKYFEELDALDQQATDKRTRQQMDEGIRNKTNFDEELCANLTEAYRQIGINRHCGDSLPPCPEKYYTITITTPGWKNLDIYVNEATIKRQSMDYTEPVTGKKASLIYKEVSMEIDQAHQYDRIFVYLLPDGLSSFQRVDLKNNRYVEKLNSIFSYDAVVLAYKGTKPFYFLQKDIQPQSYRFSLAPITEYALIKTLNSRGPAMKKDLIADFQFSLFEQEEVKRKLQLGKDTEFRDLVAKSIFNCLASGNNK
jgi:hypothetical protein